MTGLAIVGAAGRMGRRLVANALSTPGMSLAGAVEHPACPFLGQDAAVVAGLPPCGVKIVSSFEEGIAKADTVIIFATGSVIEDVRKAAAKGCAVVIGTTALTDSDREELRKLGANGAKIVQATNFSVGVNLLFHLSAMAAKLLDDSFDIEIIEAHHNQKKDAPSGTAVTLAETVAEARRLSYPENAVFGRNGIVGARKKTEIGMHSVRGGDIVGDHTIMFCGQGERFELTHRASSRDTFARGAIRAAAFLETAKPGFYTMRDVLGLK